MVYIRLAGNHGPVAGHRPGLRSDGRPPVEGAASHVVFALTVVRGRGGEAETVERLRSSELEGVRCQGVGAT